MHESFRTSHGKFDEMNHEPHFRLAVESDAGTLLRFMREYYAFDGHGFEEPKAHVALSTLLRDENLGRAWLILDGGGRGRLRRPMLQLQPGMARPRCLRRRTLPARGVSPTRLGTQDSGIRGRSRALGGIRTLHLEVMRENAAALQIYQKLGFVEHASTFLSKWIAQDFSKPQGRHGH